MPHLWESVRLRLPPFYITPDCYLDCRNALPDADWSGFESRLEIQIRRSAEGERGVMVLEDTEAATAIRGALDALITGDPLWRAGALDTM